MWPVHIYFILGRKREGEAISSSARVSTVFLLGEKKKTDPSLHDTDKLYSLDWRTFPQHTHRIQTRRPTRLQLSARVSEMVSLWLSLIWCQKHCIILSSDPKHMKSKAKSSKQMRKRLNREQRAEDWRRGEWNELKNCWQVRRWSRARGEGRGEA